MELIAVAGKAAREISTFGIPYSSFMHKTAAAAIKRGSGTAACGEEVPFKGKLLL